MTSSHDNSLAKSNPRREFAVAVLRRLRAAGFEALWAGGCVRDQLLEIEPADFDVATSATPDDVIRLFSRARTIPVGASFGVIIVLGPTKAAGQIEVATFRRDGAYLDGRRPESVVFSTAEEDARRRDFTINGMFYDPIAEQVIDYVGGRADLELRVIRAIGDPRERFTEDKLRLLRAIRFTARFGFELEPRTRAALDELRARLIDVSPERIAQELRRMLAHGSRAHAVELLMATGLFDVAFGVGLMSRDEGRIGSLLPSILAALTQPSFEPSFAAIVLRIVLRLDGSLTESALPIARQLCRSLKFSNDETDCIIWILEHLPTLRGISDKPLHVLKPILADPRQSLLRDLSRAIALAADERPVDDDFCRQYLASTPSERLKPPPFIDGRDVMALGIPPGPAIRDLLQRVRQEQLDEVIASRDKAVVRLKGLVADVLKSLER